METTLRSLRNPAIFHSALLRKFRRFPSQASSFSSFYGRSEASDGPSSVYRHALKFQRPSTMEWREQLYNSVSFIGNVAVPLKRVNCARFGVCTTLHVKCSPAFGSSFMILLKMWDKMAEVSIRHLKQNDFIYVSGSLGSYTKADVSGRLKWYYEVTVEELNYVSQHSQGTATKKSRPSESGDETTSTKEKNHLYLWQVFFTSPHEWWDNRKTKLNPKYPDFKHKATGEALWISCDDPPWVQKRLQLHDSRLLECGRERRDAVTCLPLDLYDILEGNLEQR